MTILQIVLIAAIAFILFGLILFLAMGSGSKQKKKNIDLIRGKNSETYVDEKDLQSKRRAEIAKKLKANKENDGKNSDDKVSLQLKLMQAGLKTTPVHFWFISAVCGVSFAVLAKIMAFSGMFIIFVGIIGLLGLPRFILKKMIARRQKKFLQEFADALEAVVRLLKAGMPVAEAVAMISKEFDGPVGEEMSIVYDKQKIGIPLHEAAFEGTLRMPLPEMQMFATGLAIQAQTGSSLSDVLMNLAGVIRARFRLKRKIMALSSEAIASASIIAALPPFVASGLWLVNPDYLEPLFITDTGKYLLMGAACWMSLGIFIMKQMINFKI